MKKLFALTILLAALLSQGAKAQEAPGPDATAKPEVTQALNDVKVLPRPQDFATAQQLAVQNRNDRMTMLQNSIACVKQATTMEGIYRCQSQEGMELAKIRLAYCDTTVSFPTKTGRKAPAYTECERAMAAVVGKKLPRRGKKGGAEQQAEPMDAEPAQ